MSVAVWPTLMIWGAGIMCATGVLMIPGGIAGIVGNDRLANLLVIRIGPPPFLFGTALFFLGFGGWWTVLAVAAVVGFGWLVRPRAVN